METLFETFGSYYWLLMLLPLLFMFGLLPDQTDVHVDAALTNFAQQFLQEPAAFTFDQVFTSMPVSKATDKYYTYSRDDFWRDEGDASMLLGDGAHVRRGGFRMSTASFSCDVRAYGHPITKGRRKNADAAINVDKDGVNYVLQKLLVRHGAQWVTEFFAGSIWGTTTTLSGTDQWSDFANSDPVAAIDTACVAVEAATGHWPNRVVVGRRVDIKLRRHPVIQALYNVTDADSITDEMLARVFNVEKYVVLKAVKATNIEGATAAFDYIAGKHCLVCYVAPDGSDGATAGKVFTWDGWGNDQGVAIQTYYEEQSRSDIIEGFLALDFKVTSTALGYFYENAVA